MSRNGGTSRVLRGEIWSIDWSPGRGSEQQGCRPAIVVQCDAANKNPNYPNIIVAAVSGQGKAVPFHVRLTPSSENGLKKESYVKCEQIMTCSKERLSRRWGRVSPADLARIDAGMRITLEL